MIFYGLWNWGRDHIWYTQWFSFCVNNVSGTCGIGHVPSMWVWEHLVLRTVLAILNASNLVAISHVFVFWKQCFGDMGETYFSGVGSGLCAAQAWSQEQLMCKCEHWATSVVVANMDTTRANIRSSFSCKWLCMYIYIYKFKCKNCTPRMKNKNIRLCCWGVGFFHPPLRSRRAWGTDKESFSFELVHVKDMSTSHTLNWGTGHILIRIDSWNPSSW
jgi:hypothetical protein